MLGQWLHRLDFVTEYLSVVLQCVLQWFPLLFPTAPDLFYFIVVLLAIGHIYCQCSVHISVVALVLLVCWFIYSCCRWGCSFLGGTGKFMISFLRLFICIHPWRWGCLIFHPWNLELFLIRGYCGGGECIPVIELNLRIKTLSQFPYFLSWDSPTWKCDSCRGVCRAFSRSVAELMAIYL